MVTHIAKIWINRVRLPTLLLVSWTGEMNISLSAFVAEHLVSRDGFGSPVLRQPVHLRTQAESGAYGIPPEFRGGVHLFILDRHTPSGQSRVYRVTQLRIDGVHCRESAGTGPVNKPQGSSKRMLPWQATMDQLICASLSRTHYWYKVGMLKVPAVYSVMVGFSPTLYIYPTLYCTVNPARASYGARPD